MSFPPNFKPKEPTTEDLLGLINKSLPFSDESEKGILSCLLQDPDNRLPECKSLIPAAAFYHSCNRLIYETLVELWEAAVPIDIVTLTHSLRELNKLDKVGGGAAISELYTFIPVAAHYPFYLKVVMDKYHLRSLIRACCQITVAAQQHGRDHIDEDVEPILNEAETRVRSVRDGTAAGEFKSTPDWMDILGEDIDRQVVKSRTLGLEGETAIAGVSTGIWSLDERTHGYCQGHVWLVQAKSSDGKTAWAIQQGLTLAMSADQIPCCHYLIEGSAKDFWKRCLSHLTRIDLNRILSGQLTDEELTLLSGTMDLIRAAPFHLRHKPGITKREILADMRLMHRKHGRPSKSLPEMLFTIDYIQRVKGKERFQEEWEHLMATSAEITDLTGNLKSSTIILAQLADDGKTAGSKALTCDSDVTLTISCPPALDEHGKPFTKTNRFGDVVITKRDDSKRMITFGKVRTSKRGLQPVTLEFKGEIQRFS